MKFNTGDTVVVRVKHGRVTWGNVTAIYPKWVSSDDVDYRYEVFMSALGIRQDFDEKDLRKPNVGWIYGAGCGCGAEKLKHPGHAYFCDLDKNERLWKETENE